MKVNYWLGAGLVLGVGAIAIKVPTATAAETTTPLYRVYNPNSGEHLYTVSETEKAYLTQVGWQIEGIAWQTPSTGDAVYRLYNANEGGHMYTKDKTEYDQLVAAGWVGEGVSFYSADQNQASRTPIYRTYTPSVEGRHLFTADSAEKQQVVSEGAQDEGVAFYGVSTDNPNAQSAQLAVQVASGKVLLTKLNQLDGTLYGKRGFENLLKNPAITTLKSAVESSTATTKSVTDALKVYQSAISPAYNKVVYIGYAKDLLNAEYETGDFQAGMQENYQEYLGSLRKTIAGADEGSLDQAQVEVITSSFATHLDNFLNENGMKKIPAKTFKPTLKTTIN